MDNYIYISIYIIVSIVFIVLTGAIYRRILLPNTIFTTLWSLVGIMAIVNTIGFIKPSGLIHHFVFISILTFNLVYILFSPRSKRANNLKEISTNIEKYQINYMLVYILVFLAISLISVHTINAVKIVSIYGFDMTRIRVSNFSSVENSRNIFFGLLTRSFPFAITTSVSVLGCINLNLGKKKVVMCSVLMVIIYAFTFGGRLVILNFISFYLGSYLSLRNKKKIKMKKKYIVIAITALAAMTILRGGNLSSVFGSIISYFVASLSFLEVIIRNPVSFGLKNSHTFGYLTFGFILEPIVLACKFFLGLDIKVPSYYFNIHAQDFINIGDSSLILYNNNTTMFYNFLYDFGDCGIVIGTFVIALLMSYFEINYNKHNNTRSLLLLVFFYSVIINSTMMYTLTSINASLVLIFLIIFVKKKRRVELPIVLEDELIDE